MHRILTTSVLAVLLVTALTACSNDGDGNSVGESDTSNVKPLDATRAFTEVANKVASAKLSGTVTAENDPNELLGRPHQYTSKVTFSDSRISADDLTGTDKGDVSRGGAIESFATAADAEARAKYIQSVTKSMSALAEYDYAHGTVVVRVSHYLTPKQAAAYKTATNGLS
ncbi:hypothetical protein [Streptomyces sp. NBC_01428]|uniref:hypothetical protein n=1 Tax=Streptomyces sp. NBC_01428 TaxID=2903861 RepID=UPI002E30D97F|nr:hypothetical protein [Streptomyces sp. NBC_01428]